MGRKSSAKGTPPPAPPVEPPKRSLTPLVVIVATAAIAIGAFAYMRSPGPDDVAQAAASTNSAAPAESLTSPPPEAPPQDLKPHPQEKLPPLQFPGYPMARPAETVR